MTSSREVMVVPADWTFLHLAKLYYGPPPVNGSFAESPATPHDELWATGVARMFRLKVPGSRFKVRPPP